MSSTNDNQEYNPVANLNMQPAKGILKSTKSIDDARQDFHHETRSTLLNNSSGTGMTRSESKSHKIPHFDEMNIIATYHPADKDYGHMKIEEPKTPYAPNDIIDEEVESEPNTTGIDPSTLAQRLNDSTKPSSKLRSDHINRRSTDDETEHSAEDLEHRKQFENHRKQHYNEFELVRLRKKEIEDELRALEQEEKQESTASGSSGTDEGKGNAVTSSPRSSIDSIKPILVHHQSRDSTSPAHHHQHHVHVEDDHIDDQTLTPEERERKKQFELKRKQHYNEFRAARMADKDDDEPNLTG